MATLRPGKKGLFTGMAALVGGLLLLGGCAPGDGQTQTSYPEKDQFGNYNPTGGSNRSVMGGEGGFNLLGGGPKKKDDDQGGGIGVNSFLWRASLDTISFMPLAGTPDPFGGVIVTDWYTPPQTPAERFKVNIYILDRTLRADGVRVGVFRQVRQGDGWIDQPAAANTATNLENAILQRAREFRMEAEARR